MCIQFIVLNNQLKDWEISLQLTWTTLLFYNESNIQWDDISLHKISSVYRYFKVQYSFRRIVRYYIQYISFGEVPFLLGIESS